MPATNHLLEIATPGQGIWMDHLSQDTIQSGELKNRVKTGGLRGIISNSTIANAKRADQKYKKIIQIDRWQALVTKGAKAQNLPWVGISTKNPNYSDVKYGDELVGVDTVNPLPPSTIETCADHWNGDDRLKTDVDAVRSLINRLKDPSLAIDLNQTMDKLLVEGIDKFIQPLQSLTKSLSNKAKRLATV